MALPPPQSRSPLYKTEMCRGWSQTGTCFYDAKCQFAHGAHELRPRVRAPQYKTQACEAWWQTGSCPYADRCIFLHVDRSSVLPPGGFARSRAESAPQPHVPPSQQGGQMSLSEIKAQLAMLESTQVRAAEMQAQLAAQLASQLMQQQQQMQQQQHMAGEGGDGLRRRSYSANNATVPNSSYGHHMGGGGMEGTYPQQHGAPHPSSSLATAAAASSFSSRGDGANSNALPYYPPTRLPFPPPTLLPPPRAHERRGSGGGGILANTNDGGGGFGLNSTFSLRHALEHTVEQGDEEGGGAMNAHTRSGSGGTGVGGQDDIGRVAAAAAAAAASAASRRGSRGDGVGSGAMASGGNGIEWGRGSGGWDASKQQRASLIDPDVGLGAGAASPSSPSWLSDGIHSGSFSSSNPSAAPGSGSFSSSSSGGGEDPSTFASLGNNSILRGGGMGGDGGGVRARSEWDTYASASSANFSSLGSKHGGGGVDGGLRLLPFSPPLVPPQWVTQQQQQQQPQAQQAQQSSSQSSSQHRGGGGFGVTLSHASHTSQFAPTDAQQQQPHLYRGGGAPPGSYSSYLTDGTARGSQSAPGSTNPSRSVSSRELSPNVELQDYAALAQQAHAQAARQLLLAQQQQRQYFAPQQQQQHEEAQQQQQL